MRDASCRQPSAVPIYLDVSILKHLLRKQKPLTHHFICRDTNCHEVAQVFLFLSPERNPGHQPLATSHRVTYGWKRAALVQAKGYYLLSSLWLLVKTHSFSYPCRLFPTRTTSIGRTGLGYAGQVSCLVGIDTNEILPICEKRQLQVPSSEVSMICACYLLFCLQGTSSLHPAM